MRVLTPKVKLLADFVSTDRTRRALNGVCIDENRAIATDGHFLVECPLGDKEMEKDYPAIEGHDLNDTGTRVIVSAESLQKAYANIPKKPTLPVLENVLFGVEPGNAIASLTTTDLKNSTSTRTTLIEGPYPNTDAVIPKEEPLFMIQFDAELLSRLNKLAKGVLNNPVVLSFFGPEKGITFSTASGYSGVIMPLRMTGDDQTKAEQCIKRIEEGRKALETVKELFPEEAELPAA